MQKTRKTKTRSRDLAAVWFSFVGICFLWIIISIYEEDIDISDPFPGPNQVEDAPPGEDPGGVHCEHPIQPPNRGGFSAAPGPDWQPVEPNISYSYSAFADLRDAKAPVLRVLGVHQVNPLPDNFSLAMCRMWYAGACQPVLVPASVRVLPIEKFPYKFRPVFFVCALSRRLPHKHVPYAVSLVLHPCRTATNIHYIHVISKKTPQSHVVNFTVCVPPFHNGFNNVYDLVEHIEVNSLLGADKFIFYNYSSSAALTSVLNGYNKEGKVDVMKWTLPASIELQERLYYGDLMYYGQSAAVTDCLYRTMYRTKYTVFLDLDEFIVPRIVRNWEQMLTDVLDNPFLGMDQRPVASIRFHNVFFDRHLQLDDPGGTPNSVLATVLPHIKTVSHTKRRSKIFTERCKYMVLPELVDVANIHFVTRFHGDAKQVEVPPEKGLLHHYRYWEAADSPMPWFLDEYMHGFRQEIVSRVVRRLVATTYKQQTP